MTRSFDRAKFEEAVEIHTRAYRLLRWVNDAVDRGFIAFTSAHYYASDAQAAATWVEEHYQNLPPECRPSDRTGAGLSRFGNYFATYINTSFELVATPGVQRRSSCGCHCWCCTYLGAAPHLKTRSVTPSDKKRASRLQRKVLAQLALDHGLAVSEGGIDAIADAAETAEATALVAYGLDLLARCSGQPAHPATHALWRVFAWEKAGSPKKGFVLQADAFLAAEAQVVQALRATASRETVGRGM
jgi:hypothetical protein